MLAWYVALLLLPDQRPAFASIAAVIAVGATYGQRGARAAELIGGVVVGLSVADVIVRAIGSGPLQMGLMVVLAMSTAVVLGGGALLVTEAAVSALLLLAAMDPATVTVGPGLSPIRFAEALIGGGVALGVTSLFFPPDPALIVGRAVQSVFAELGRSLERIAGALARRRRGRRAARAAGARATSSTRIDALDDAFAAGRETARLAPPRRRARAQIDRYGRTLAQVDFAVRNTRVLARDVAALHPRRRAGAARAGRGRPRASAPRSGSSPPPTTTRGAPARSRASPARPPRARPGVAERPARPALVEIAGQVRSTAVDLVRAAELVADGAPAPEELPTEELLLAPAEAGPRRARRQAARRSGASRCTPPSASNATSAIVRADAAHLDDHAPRRWWTRMSASGQPERMRAM